MTSFPAAILESDSLRLCYEFSYFWGNSAFLIVFVPNK